MSFLSRLLGTAPDPREGVRPLWHRVIELARDTGYYTECGVADSIAGRFDMITLVLSTVMVRLEASELRAESALLAELFVMVNWMMSRTRAVLTFKMGRLMSPCS